MVGCPFTNFGPCAEERCAFFVPLPPENSRRSCAIRETYIQTVINSITMSWGMWCSQSPSSGDPPLFVSPAYRAAESLLGCLRTLEEMTTSPLVDAADKAKLADILQDVRNHLQKLSST